MIVFFANLHPITCPSKNFKNKAEIFLLNSFCNFVKTDVKKKKNGKGKLLEQNISSLITVNS